MPLTGLTRGVVPREEAITWQRPQRADPPNNAAAALAALVAEGVSSVTDPPDVA